MEEQSDFTFQQVIGINDSDLVEAVRQKLWDTVRELLECDVHHTTRRWAVQRVISQSDVSDGQLLYILPHCTDDQVDRALTLAVNRCMWGVVAELLARNTNDAKRTWVVEESAKCAGDEQLVLIIKFCTDDQLDALLKTAVGRHHWMCVRHLLERDVTDTQRKWALDEAVSCASDDELLPLLAYCPEDQVKSVVRHSLSRHLWNCVLTLLERGCPESVSELAVREASEQADEYQLLPLLSFCTDAQYESVLVKTIQRGCWRAADLLLHRKVEGAHVQSALKKATEHWDEDDFDSAVRAAVRYETWAMTSRLLEEQDVSESTFSFIVQTLCDLCRTNDPDVHVTEEMTELFSVLLKAAASKRMWSSVLDLLPFEVPCAGVVEEAIKHAEDKVLKKVLPRCADDQLEAALESAVTKRLWSVVGTLLQRKVSDIKQAWAVQTALTNARAKHLETILPHCVDSQLDMVMDRAVSLRLWKTVVRLLERPMSNAKRAWTIEQAIQHASKEHLESILPHCTQDQLDSALMKAVETGLWDCADTLLHRRRDICDDTRVGEYITNDKLQVGLMKIKAAGKHVNRIGMNTQTRDHLVVEAIARGSWERIGTILPSLDQQLQKFVWLEASRFAPLSVLQSTNMKSKASCLGDVKDQVLRNLVNRDMWSIVRYFCSAGHGLELSVFGMIYRDQSFSDTLKMFILQEASKRATGDDLEDILGSLCTKSDVDLVLPNLLDRRQWKALRRIFCKLSAEQAELVLQKGDQNADKETLACFFDGCLTTQLNDGVVRLAVKHGFWFVVSWYMETSGFHIFLDYYRLQNHRHSISEELRRWVIDEALERAGDSDFGSIAPHCLDDQLQRVLTETVSRRLWGVTEQLMKRETDTEKLQWVVVTASKYADEDSVLSMARDYCSSTTTECVLTHAVKRDMWRVVVELLQKEPRPSEAQCKWVIQEALKRAENYQLCMLLPFCGCDQLEDFMKEAVNRRLWKCVADLFSREITDDVQKWAWDKSVKHLTESQMRSIIPFCADNQLKTVLTELVTRGQWDSVLEFLKQKSDCSLQSWAVTEASKRAPEYKFRKLIPYCDYDQLDSVLMEMVRREMWTCVCELLKREVSSRQRQWALEKASQTAPEDHLVSLLQYATDDQLCSVLKEAVRRHMWKCVHAILERDVDPVQKEFAIREASIQASDFKLMPLLPFVTENCLHFVLTAVVGRRMWDCIPELLKRELQEKDRKFALEEASRHAAEANLLRMMEHCPDDAVESVFVELLKRRLWLAINRLLCRPLDIKQKLALKELTNQTKMDFEAEIRSAVLNRSWAVVSFLLECTAVTDETRRYAVNIAFNSTRVYQRCEERDFVSLLQHCDHTQLLSALQAAVKLNLPQTACDILTRIGQEGNPLAVTDDNRTILLVCMEIRSGRRRLMAECLKLGVGTRQPQGQRMNSSASFRIPLLINSSNRTPCRRAALDNDLVLVRMLLEAGVCSNSEVHELTGEFSTWSLQSELFETTFQSMFTLLRDTSSTPRSLKSACRLVISHHLGVGCGRPERVQQLPLPERMKDYISFCDLETLEDDTMSDEVTRSDDAAAAVQDVTMQMVSAEFYDWDDSDYDYYDDDYYSSGDYDSSFDDYVYYDSD